MEHRKRERKSLKAPENTIEILSDDYFQYDLSFKLIVIGDTGVGKSCLTSKAAKDEFREYYQATIGFEFITFNIKLDNTVIKLQIWDTCGQEAYRSLISTFYRNSSLAIMVFAINDRKTFLSMDNWLNELRNQSNQEVKIFLVGNKTDLEEERQVTTREAEEYVKEKGLDLFLETSAKTGFNTKNVLIEAAKLLYSDYIKLKEMLKTNPSLKENYHIGLNQPKGERLEKPNKEIITPKANHKKNCC